MMPKTLKAGGQALIKIMRGPSIDEVIEAYMINFNSVIKVKPSASRSESNELYILASGYEQSEHQFIKDSKKAQLDARKLNTSKSFEDFDNDVHDEGKQIAESMLKDLRR